VTLGELLTRAALRRPEAEAVVDGARRLSYAELDARAATAARGFRRLGVGKRDRVLIALKNRLEHVVAYWALQKLGGVPTPVNFRFAPAELGYVLEDSGAKVALFEEATAPAVTEAARGRGVKDVAVAGEADERLGERVAAFVVPGAGVTAEELDRFCRESPDLASFKRPRRFVFLKEIPKTASGKILRRLLREGRYTEGHP